MVTLTAETLPLSSVTVSAPEMVISEGLAVRHADLQAGRNGEPLEERGPRDGVGDRLSQRLVDGEVERPARRDDDLPRAAADADVSRDALVIVLEVGVELRLRLALAGRRVLGLGDPVIGAVAIVDSPLVRGPARRHVAGPAQHRRRDAAERDVVALRHRVGGAVRGRLGRVARVADHDLALDRWARHSLLHGVRDLVGQEAPALGRLGAVLAAAHPNRRAQGEGARAQRLGGLRRAVVGDDADAIERHAEAPLERAAHPRGERPPRLRRRGEVAREPVRLRRRSRRPGRGVAADRLLLVVLLSYPSLPAYMRG